MHKLITAIVLMSAICIYSDPIPDLEVPQSLGIQTKTHNCAVEDLEQIRELGVTFIRRGFYWAAIEKERGIYDFSEYDRLLKDTNARGLRVLGCLYGGNTLYENDNQGGIQTDAGRKGFANFSAALAEHFKGHGIIWEIWNEPNIGSFWRRGEHNTDEFAAEYTALVKETVPAMHAANPECFVIAGAVSALWEPSFNWMHACFENGMLQSGINGWSIHPYSFRTPEEQADGYKQVRESLASHGVPENFPLFNSERGFTVDTTRREGWTGGLEEKAPEYMAWHFVRQYMVDLMNDIRLTIYYEWSGEDFGVIWGEEKRPAYHACVNMVKQLKGYTLKQRLNTSSPLDYLLLFENKAGKQKLVAWTAPPVHRTPEEAVIHPVEIPMAARGTLSACDLYGKQFPVKVTDGKISLNLSGLPQYISL